MNREAIAHVRNKQILFSPLNWGFGHVSRSIPILQQLLKQDNFLWIACDCWQREIYELYLPNVNFVSHEGYPFDFKGNGNFGLDLIRSFPKLFLFSKKEAKFVKDFSKKYSIELIVSDHRYFFRNSSIPSIFITHQLTLPLPWYLKLAQTFHRKLIHKFNEIWLLDLENHRFAGKLSRGKTKIPQRFIGPVSRFENAISKAKKSGTLVLVSGPEPYAEQFYREQKLKERTESVKFIYNGFLESMDERKGVNWLEIDELMLVSEKIISRSGYSTIMDTHYLDCKVEFFPTKGQAEQEFLAIQNR